MAIVTYEPQMWRYLEHLFVAQSQPEPRLRRGTKARRAKKVYRLWVKGPSFPRKRYPGRKGVSRGLGRNIK